MSRDTYYWTCPYCKANLDPDEKCDCQNERLNEEDNDIDNFGNYKLVQKGGDENV